MGEPIKFNHALCSLCESFQFIVPKHETLFMEQFAELP